MASVLRVRTTYAYYIVYGCRKGINPIMQCHQRPSVIKFNEVHIDISSEVFNLKYNMLRPSSKITFTVTQKLGPPALRELYTPVVKAVSLRARRSRGARGRGRTSRTSPLDPHRAPTPAPSAATAAARRGG